MAFPPTARCVYVSPSKGPIYSIPGLVFLLVHITGSDVYTSWTAGKKFPSRMKSLWGRGKAKVNRLLGNKPPETSIRHESDYLTLPPTHLSRPPTPPTRLIRPLTPPTRLVHPPTLPTPPRAPPPYDIAEMIIAHLTRDLRTLKACSLTCRSLCMAAAPHLHHTLTLKGGRPEIDRSRLEPLSRLHELDLMPLVREIRVKQGGGSSSWLVPRAFGHLDLCHFSAFENVHTLKIQNMEVYRFIPGVERHFEQFSPTLRSIWLYKPRCTPRQLSYFLSLFPHLDDISISIESGVTHVPNTIVPDVELVPFSAPKLQGRLALYEFSWVETLTHLITSSGGLRFRQIDLHGSGCCTPLLFEACARTLETLRLHMGDGSVSE